MFWWIWWFPTSEKTSLKKVQLFDQAVDDLPGPQEAGSAEGEAEAEAEADGVPMGTSKSFKSDQKWSKVDQLIINQYKSLMTIDDYWWWVVLKLKNWFTYIEYAPLWKIPSCFGWSLCITSFFELLGARQLQMLSSRALSLRTFSPWTSMTLAKALSTLAGCDGCPVIIPKSMAWQLKYFLRHGIVVIYCYMLWLVNYVKINLHSAWHCLSQISHPKFTVQESRCLRTSPSRSQCFAMSLHQLSMARRLEHVGAWKRWKLKWTPGLGIDEPALWDIFAHAILPTGLLIGIHWEFSWIFGEKCGRAVIWCHLSHLHNCSSFNLSIVDLRRWQIQRGGRADDSNLLIRPLQLLATWVRVSHGKPM